MKKSIIAVLLIASMMMICLGGCEKKETNTPETPENTIEIVEQAVTDDTPEEVVEIDNEVINEEPEEELNDVEEEFDVLEGTYDFTSGVGAWYTECIVNKDGTFEGHYKDTNMGDMCEAYKGGTVELCDFIGTFSDLKKVDEYTYTAKVSSLEITSPTDTEEIEDEVRYHYTEAYGFEVYDVIEFYLPGKPIAELSSAFLSWTSLRYCSVYPAFLYSKSFYNVKAQAGFESHLRDNEVQNIPQSLDCDFFELAGQYDGENGTIMSISIYSYIEDNSEIGNITWIEDENSPYQPEANIGCAENGNGFVGKPEWETPYFIIVTDNTSGNIELTIYDDYGFNCGKFKMTQHYES